METAVLDAVGIKLTIGRKELHEAVATASRAVTGRSTLQILSNMYIKAQDGELTLTATDLELSIECRVKADVRQAGAVTSPAKLLSEITGSLPDEEVVLETMPSGALKIQCNAAEYELLGQPPNEFPMLPSVEGGTSLSLRHPDLKEMIRQTIYAVSGDDTRPQLTGVLFILNDGCLKAVATDTHRLSLKTLLIADAGGEAYAIIPSRAITELSRVLSDDENAVVDIAFKENQVQFKTESVTLISRLIDGQFPNFERVIPTGGSHKITMMVQPTIAALKRALIVAREAGNRVHLSFVSGKMLITSDAQNVGRAKEELDVVQEGEQIEAAYNARYLIDALEAVTTEGAVLELSEPLKPGLLKPIGTNDFQAVIMPMQLS
jgi:DNA polymerase-3 subunit beta